MAQWINITTDDLNQYIAAPVLSKLRQTALALNQADPVTEITRDVSRRIRTEIRGNGTNRVSQTPDTIPPELKAIAIALIVEAAYNRLPGILLNSDQANAADEARAFLQRIAQGKVPVSAPDLPEEPDDVQRAQSTEVVTSRKNPVNSKRLSRLGF